MKVEKIKWDSQLKDLLPTGMLWNFDEGSNFDLLTKSLQSRLEDTEFGMVDLFNALMPDTVSDEFVRRWEIQLGIPDDCTRMNSYTLEERKRNIVSKLRLTGGQSIKYYTSLMESLGYNYNSVDEFSASRIGDDCDSFLRGSDWDYTWRVNIAQDAKIESFATCESECDVFLGSVSNDLMLECLLQSVKPAHTLLLFDYFEVFRDNYTLEEAYLNMYKKINGSRVFITDLGEEYIKEDLYLITEDRTKRLYTDDTTYPLTRDLNNVSLEPWDTQPTYVSEYEHFVKDDNNVYQRVNSNIKSIDGLPINKAMVGAVEVDPDGAINIQNNIAMSCKIHEVTEGVKQFVMGKGSPPEIEFLRTQRQYGNESLNIIDYHEFPINNFSNSIMYGVTTAISNESTASVRYVLYKDGIEVGSSVPEIDYTNKATRTILDGNGYQYIEFDSPITMPIGDDYTMRIYVDEEAKLRFGTKNNDGVLIPYFESTSDFEDVPYRKYGCHVHLDENDKLVFTVDDSNFEDRVIVRTIDKVRDGDVIRVEFNGDEKVYINGNIQALEIIENGRVLSIANSGETFIIGDDRYGMISEAEIFSGSTRVFHAPFNDSLLDTSIYSNKVNSNYAFLQGYEIVNKDNETLLFGSGYAPHSTEVYNNVVSYDEAKMLFNPSGASYITDDGALVFEGGASNLFSNSFEVLNNGDEFIFSMYIPPMSNWSDSTAEITMFIGDQETSFYSSNEWQTVSLNYTVTGVTGDLVSFGLYSDKQTNIGGIKGVKVEQSFTGSVPEHPFHKFFTRKFEKGTINFKNSHTILKDTSDKFNNLQGVFLGTVEFSQATTSNMIFSYNDISISYVPSITTLSIRINGDYNDFIIPLVGEKTIGISWISNSMTLFIDGVRISSFAINWPSILDDHFIIGNLENVHSVRLIKDVVISKTWKDDSILIKATTPL